MCDVNIVVFKNNFNNRNNTNENDNEGSKTQQGDGYDFTKIINKNRREGEFKGKGGGFKGKGGGFKGKGGGGKGFVKTNGFSNKTE